MAVVRAEYIIGIFLIVLGGKGSYEVSVPQLYKYGVALQQGPFSDGSALIHYSHYELMFAARHDSLFYLCRKGDIYYIGISDKASILDIKTRYLGFIPPQVLIKIYRMAQKMCAF